VEFVEVCAQAPTDRREIPAAAVMYEVVFIDDSHNVKKPARRVERRAYG
jgi:hypothetical protein